MRLKIKHKYPFIISIVIIISILIFPFLFINLYSDHSISGFAGFYGIYILEITENDIVPLTSSPLQYMAKNTEIENALSELADSYKVYAEKGGTLSLDNTQYTYNLRAFTDSFSIITLEKLAP